jgi:ABC-2 type transport system permease protein
MRKYWHVFGIGIQNTLVYRSNFLFRAAFGLIPLAGTLFLWQAIYAGKPGDALVSQYTLAQMISYYLVLTLVDALTVVAEDDWQIAADIREGTISQFLVRPINYLGYRITLYFAGRSIYTVVAIVPVGLFILYMREYLVGPASLGMLSCAVIATFLAGILQFLIAYTLALLAFWVLDVSTFIFIAFAVEYLASGHLFPLDILPTTLQGVLNLTPYPYLLYFPVGLYLGRFSDAQVLHGFAMQMMWVCIAFAMARWVLSRGVTRYSAFGG